MSDVITHSNAINETCSKFSFASTWQAGTEFRQITLRIIFTHKKYIPELYFMLHNFLFLIFSSFII